MSLIRRIKEEEGFRSRVYRDTEGFDTIGYGTKLPITEEEAEMLLRYRFDLAKKEIDYFCTEVVDEAKEIIYEMAYQLGVKGVLSFKKMFKALNDLDYKRAAEEMQDSLWFTQTPNRAKRLIKRMEELG